MEPFQNDNIGNKSDSRLVKDSEILFAIRMNKSSNQQEFLRYWSFGAVKS